MARHEPLKLLAEDADDLAVISAAPPDAVAPGGDIEGDARRPRGTLPPHPRSSRGKRGPRQAVDKGTTENTESTDVGGAERACQGPSVLSVFSVAKEELAPRS